MSLARVKAGKFWPSFYGRLTGKHTQRGRQWVEYLMPVKMDPGYPRMRARVFLACAKSWINPITRDAYLKARRRHWRQLYEYHGFADDSTISDPTVFEVLYALEHPTDSETFYFDGYAASASPNEGDWQ